MEQEKGWSLTLQFLWQVVHDETKFYNLIMRYSDVFIETIISCLEFKCFCSNFSQ